MDGEHLEPLIDADASEDESTPTVSQSCCNRLISWHKKIAPVEIIVIHFVVGNSIAYPAMQFYCIHYINALHSNQSQQAVVSTACERSGVNNATDSANVTVGFGQENDAEKEKAKWFLYFSLVTTLCSILPTLLSGSLSDHYGRKPLLGVLLAAGILQYLSWVCVMYFQLPVGYLAIGCAFEGITGSYYVAFMSLMTVVADVTDPGKQRAFRMTVAEGCAELAIGVAGILAGYWINNNSNYIYPVVVSVLVNTVALVYHLVLIPETLYKQNGYGQAFKLKKCFRFMKVYSDSREPNRRCILFVCIACIMLISTYYDLPRTLYLQNAPFCWGALQITSYTAAILTLQVVTSMPGVKLMQTVFKFDEVTIAVIGCIGIAACNSSTGIAVCFQWLLFIAIPLGGMQIIISPMIRSIMSTQVSKDDQGAMFAGVACAQNVTGVVATIVCNGVYSLTLPIYDGIVFFLVVGCEILAAILLLSMAGRIRNRRSEISLSVQYSCLNSADNEIPSAVEDG